jgi:hypothetical protein
LTFEIKFAIGATAEHSVCASERNYYNMDGYIQNTTCGVVHRDLHNGASWLGQQLVILCSL